jgi:hypothetical protein
MLMNPILLFLLSFIGGESSLVRGEGEERGNVMVRGGERERGEGERGRKEERRGREEDEEEQRGGERDDGRIADEDYHFFFLPISH